MMEMMPWSWIHPATALRAVESALMSPHSGATTQRAVDNADVSSSRTSTGTTPRMMRWRLMSRIWQLSRIHSTEAVEVLEEVVAKVSEVDGGTEVAEEAIEVSAEVGEGIEAAEVEEAEGVGEEALAANEEGWARRRGTEPLSVAVVKWASQASRGVEGDELVVDTLMRICFSHCLRITWRTGWGKEKIV
jgi:hypothetical protein